MKKYFIYIFFFTTTGLFSYVGFNTYDVKIIGPVFDEINYLENELSIIENELGVKIGYKAVADPETFIVENPDTDFDIGIIPNPQGVTNLASRNLIKNVSSVTIDKSNIYNSYPDHLVNILSVNDQLFGGWIRLFPNSLLWYDNNKINNYSNIDLSNFDSLSEYTKKLADEGTPSWCLNSESGAAQGLIQTNWLENILLTKYGPKTYDRWINLDIEASNIQIYSSIKFLGDLFLYPGIVQGGAQTILGLEFKNLPEYLLNEKSTCFLSLGGHYFIHYIDEKYEYEKDYNFVAMPSLNFEGYVVGFGDSLVMLNNNEITEQVFAKILSKDFGNSWSNNYDSQFISANVEFDINSIANPITKKEFKIIHQALQNNKFRYDASDIMARPIGADKLWKTLTAYFKEEESLVKLLNQLDKQY